MDNFTVIAFLLPAGGRTSIFAQIQTPIWQRKTPKTSLHNVLNQLAQPLQRCLTYYASRGPVRRTTHRCDVFSEDFVTSPHRSGSPWQIQDYYSSREFLAGQNSWDLVLFGHPVALKISRYYPT